MKQRRSLVLCLCLILLVCGIWLTMLIVQQQQKTLDQRVQEVAAQLNCPVCQGESVASSSSSLAVNMRTSIRKQLQEGRSEQQVIDYFAQSYGESIVLTPPQSGFTLLAWIVPILLLLGGLLLIVFIVRDWHTATGVQRRIYYEEEQADSEELALYRQRLEQELAEDDPLFFHSRTEAH